MISDAVLFLHRSYDTARVEAEILVLVGLRGLDAHNRKEISNILLTTQ